MAARRMAMTGKPGLWSLFRWMRRTAVPCGREPADAGTAFGMELFLDSIEGKGSLPEGPKRPETTPSRPPAAPAKPR